MTTTALYRHYDSTGQLLYVGISASAAARLAQHMQGSKWARDIVSVRIEHLPTREEAIAAEKRAIIEEAPLWNVTHKPAPQKPAKAKKATASKVGEGTAELALDVLKKSVACFGLLVARSKTFTLSRNAHGNIAVDGVIPARQSESLRQLAPRKGVPFYRQQAALLPIKWLSYDEIDSASGRVRMEIESPDKLTTLFEERLYGQGDDEFDQSYRQKIKPAVERYRQTVAIAEETRWRVAALLQP